MRLKPASTLLFTGDSITDAERSRPMGEDVKDQLGNGYVGLLAAIMDATSPQLGIRIVNSGVSGDTARDLAARWSRDVEEVRPDWLSVMVGINDCSRSFVRRNIPAMQVPVTEYHATLDRLLCGIRPSLQGLLLLTPFFVEPNPDDALRRHLLGYQDAVRSLAQKHDAILIDTQVVFDGLCRHDHPSRIAPDRVHPWRAGHMAIAMAVLRALEHRF